MIRIIKVTGNSLSPFFLPGEYILVWRSPRKFKNLSQGDFVVFNHSQFGLLIKKVALNNPGKKYIETEGIHPESLSKQKIGKIPYSNIIGKVIQRIRRNAV
jgi:phage repressor protein C with HTH and peptisase S24 domain